MGSAAAAIEICHLRRVSLQSITPTHSPLPPFIWSLTGLISPQHGLAATSSARRRRSTRVASTAPRPTVRAVGEASRATIFLVRAPALSPLACLAAPPLAVVSPRRHLPPRPPSRVPPLLRASTAAGSGRTVALQSPVATEFGRSSPTTLPLPWRHPTPLLALVFDCLRDSTA
ncbi:hypothetical protein PVAP13_9NG531100 [Panicum virgatum]|uniref:Uncharacterized protein n=1 Tax=Panicum virgatum TaxID=38727 RepID=A0A8T0MU76_PANVG|nr:hypothetical protein PVAP13_9NG531100 [Panicum virgatum]